MNRIEEKLLDINEYGVLKIPIELWLTLIFLVRHWIFLIFAAGSASTNQLDGLRLFSGDFPWGVLAMEMPAILVFWISLQRTPEASNFIRKIWPFSRFFLSITVILHIIYLTWYLWRSDYWLPWPELFLASTGIIDISIILNLYSSNHLNKIFKEFPASKNQTSKNI